MKDLQPWQRWAFLVAALAIIAGASFIVALAGRSDPQLEEIPEDVVREAPAPEELLPEDGRRERGGGVLVSPSEIFAEGVNSGLRLPPVLVKNRSTERKRIQVAFVPVSSFLLVGLPVIEDTPQNLALGRTQIALDQKEFVLQPGASKNIVPTILSRPDSGVIIGSIGVTVLDRLGPLSEPEKNDVRFRVQNNLRINSMAYLVFEGEEAGAVELQRLRASQGADDELLFGIRVRGQGGIASPEGNVIIRNQSGEVVAASKIESRQRVPAGVERDLRLERPIQGLRPGSYQAEARVTAAGRSQTVNWPFRIDSEGQLPSPAATVAFRANPARLRGGEKSEISIRVTNTGSKAFQPEGTIKLYKYGQGQALAKETIETEALSPGDTGETTKTIILPKQSGNYELALQIEADDGTFLEQRVTSLLVEGDPPPEPSAWIRFRDWLSDNPLGAVGVGMALFGFIVLIVASAAVFITRMRKNKSSR